MVDIKKFVPEFIKEQRKNKKDKEIELCKNCGSRCEHLYCDSCDKKISDYEFSRQDPD